MICDYVYIEIYPDSDAPENIKIGMYDRTTLDITFNGIPFFSNSEFEKGVENIPIDVARKIRDFLIYAVPENK